MGELKHYLLALGLPGLFLMALLDSAGVPLPGGVDIVILLLSWKQPTLFVPVALAAATGSTIGCWILYRIGRRGGESALRRFDPAKRDWVTDKLRRHDILAVFVAVMGPPPFPTKLFVLGAGVVGMRWHRFVLTVFLGRAMRFLAEAYLAIRLGDRAAETLQQHSGGIALALLLLVGAVLLARRILERRTRAAT